MSPHLSSELIRSIRVTLQKIDEDFPQQADEPVVAELKRLLLLRVAELESPVWKNQNQPKSLKATSPSFGCVFVHGASCLALSVRYKARQLK